MANPFPIGPQQVIKYDTLEVTLLNCDFDPDGGAGLAGYRKMREKDNLLELKRNINGTPAITGTRYAYRYNYKWALQLPAEKAFLLEAIFEEQKDAYSLFDPTPAVRVEDERIAHLESAVPSRQRAKKGTVNLGQGPAPTNFEYIFPLWDVLITEFDMTEPKLLPRDLWMVKMEAVELQVVPETEDI